jgi:RimJ/RimL family protein N-acetyltransferase
VGSLVFRPAELDDAALAADLMTAAYPSMAQDPVITRFRWESLRSGWSAARFIAELDGKPVGYLEWDHGPVDNDAELNCSVNVWLDKAALDVDRLTAMWLWVAHQAETGGSEILEGYAGEDEPEMLEALARAGFKPERRDRVWELDLDRHGDRLRKEAAEARTTVGELGIELLTMTEWNDPQALRKLHALDEATMKDMPTTFPMLPQTFEDFTRRIDAPDRARDRWWIALAGDRPVANSYLRFPPVRGAVSTGFTGCDREYRGRGIARAVKLQTLVQAIELDIHTVETDNDSENAPMLAINEKLGYRSRPGFISHLKRVSRDDDA